MNPGQKHQNSVGLYIKLFLLLAICIPNFIFCQQHFEIKGQVTDSINTPIPFLNILLQSRSQDNLIAYTSTNDDGFYVITLDTPGNYDVVIRGLSYKTKIIPVDLTEDVKVQEMNITLVSESFVLDEVILHSERPITIKKDTIVFDVSAFLKGNEAVVEDLLRNIPGLNIDTEGTIKVGNKEVEKVMVEGDDFFDKGYKILTKNMPSSPIDKVELLQNYSNNRLLKDIEQSEKIALNLKLKEDAKRIWFGNVSVGFAIDSKNRYDVLGNLMNFGKKNKYFFLTNFNNIGYEAAGNINHLVKPIRLDETSSIGDDQSVTNLVNLTAVPLNFKKNRTNFNNAELLSLNAIFNISEKLKVKALGFLNWDETNFFRNSTSAYIGNDTDFIIKEENKLRNKNRVGFGKLDLVYNLSPTKMLEMTTNYRKGKDEAKSDLLFNTSATRENLSANNTLFDQKVVFSNRWENKKALIITGRYLNEKSPQNFGVNQFFYEDLFPNSDAVDRVQQENNNTMEFAGLEAHFFKRNPNGNLLELKFGNQYRRDKLQSEFTLVEEDGTPIYPEEYQNKILYTTNDTYFKSKYRIEIRDFAFIGKLSLHQLQNQLEFINSNQNPFFINPGAGADWKINAKNKVAASYSYNTSNAEVLDVYNNYVLTGFRSFSKGTGNFNQLNASTWTINYQLGNWSDKFFANSYVIYTKNHDFFSYSNFYQQNYTQSEKILIKDRKMLSIGINIDRYIKIIASNFKINLGYTNSKYKNSINSSGLRDVNSNNYKYGFELRSGFRKVFNYHTGIEWTANKIRTTSNSSTTNNLSFLDVSLVFNEKLDVQLQTERYYFGNLDNDNNTYYFMDLNARYKLKKDKLSFSLSGKNLFNTETYRDFSISDIGNTTIEYRLLPRFLLLKTTYRF